MLKEIKIFLGIFLCLAASRFIPHPWNFTSLLALSFYVPSLLGLRYVPHLIISFAITDFIIGYHGLVFWTWGSVLIISFLTLKFKGNLKKRLSGAILGAVIFFVLTNFGVWSTGVYGYSINGLITCYNLAIPFFAASLFSTILFSSLIEFVSYHYKSRFQEV